MSRNPLNSLSRRGSLLIVFALFALMFAPPPPPNSQLSLISTVHAATINVDSTCTINQAIASANSDSTASGSSCEAGSGADTILISGHHNSTANLPNITTTITIIGSNNATISGGNQRANFLLGSSGNLTLRNLTITGGRSTYGGAVNASGNSTLTIENSVIHGNRTTNTGGGIDSLGHLTIKNSVFYSNQSNSSGAAISSGGSGSNVIIENTTFYNHTLEATDPINTVTVIFANASLTATVSHVTMVNNKNSMRLFHGTLNLRNSIITGSTGYDCSKHQVQGTLNSSGNLISDGSCSPKVSGNPKLAPLSGGIFPLLAGSPAIDAALTTHCLATDQRGTRRPQGKACDIGAIEYVPSKTDDDDDDEDEGPYIPPTPRPPTYTGEGFFQQTGIRVSATHGLRSGVQFKRIGAANIGLPEVINNGFIDAVDIFGYVNQGVEVCFPRSGALLFLDAATSPRAVLPWPSTIVDSFTCGRITRPGTLVLVPHNSRLAGPVSTPQPFPAPQSQTGLTDCYLTTTHILNLRSAPNGDIIGRVNYNATLSARARQDAWYRISVDGLSGWISADFVTTRGNCS